MHVQGPCLRQKLTGWEHPCGRLGWSASKFKALGKMSRLVADLCQAAGETHLSPSFFRGLIDSQGKRWKVTAPTFKCKPSKVVDSGSGENGWNCKRSGHVKPGGGVSLFVQKLQKHDDDSYICLQQTETGPSESRFGVGHIRRWWRVGVITRPIETWCPTTLNMNARRSMGHSLVVPV